MLQTTRIIYKVCKSDKSKNSIKYTRT